ncbi:MAG TPA: hypothetical protein VM432_04725 [Bdellovibrionales bacterium]|nr:hypothetical protein [Bdellovibrionales bacterium]
MERGLVFLRQEAEYYKVRAEQRLIFARREYLKAFNEGREWPDPAEYEEYQKMKKLREGSRRWEDRIPKLTRHQPKKDDPAQKKAESKPAAGGQE